VITGAQTVRALAKAAGSRSGSSSAEDALVLVRITEARQYGHERHFRDDMVRFNNTQNVIKASDFRSNDPVHEDLKRKFADYKRTGRKVVYGKRWLTPILSRVGFVPEDAGHETSGPAADGALAGAAWASRLEPGGAVATLRAPDLEAALVAETLRADPRG